MLCINKEPSCSPRDELRRETSLYTSFSGNFVIKLFRRHSRQTRLPLIYIIIRTHEARSEEEKNNIGSIISEITYSVSVV